MSLFLKAFHSFKKNCKNILFYIQKWNNPEEIIDKRIELIKDEVNRFCDQAKLINYDHNHEIIEMDV